MQAYDDVWMRHHLKVAGFKHDEDLIHAFLGGSHQHGAALPNKQSDVDIYGVYIEPPSSALGVSEESHFTSGTQDQYVRNRPGDEDYKCYTLRRWAGLVCKGNPTILGFLYTPCRMQGVWRDFIEPNKALFQARGHANAFLGYAQGQIKRLDPVNGSGKGKHGQRPELEELFGFDTKAAMHLMRLMFEAEEYMNTGNITYPRPERDLLLHIRQGGWKWEQLMAEYARWEEIVKKARDASKLPDQVDRQKVSELIAKCYLTHWFANGQLSPIDALADF